MSCLSFRKQRMINVISLTTDSSNIRTGNLPLPHIALQSRMKSRAFPQRNCSSVVSSNHDEDFVLCNLQTRKKAYEGRFGPETPKRYYDGDANHGDGSMETRISLPGINSRKSLALVHSIPPVATPQPSQLITLQARS